MGSAARRQESQRIVGYVLMALIVVGLIYLAHWVIADVSRPRYPGIEKLRGDLGAYKPDGVVASASVRTGG